MARFTADPWEVQHITNIQQSAVTVAMQNKWQIRAVLMNGNSVAAHFTGSSGSNNGGQGGFWAYSGEIQITDAGGNLHTIDCLEIDRITKP